MKKNQVTPILAIVITAVVLLGGKAVLSGKAAANVEIARNKMMSCSKYSIGNCPFSNLVSIVKHFFTT